MTESCDEEEEECECGEEECRACARAFKRWLEDVETERERKYQQQLWGPDGLLFDADDPFSKEAQQEKTND